MSPVRVLLGATVLIVACSADTSTVKTGFLVERESKSPVVSAAEKADDVAEEQVPVEAVAQHNGMMNAIQALKKDLWQLITTEKYQGVIAVFAMVFGIAALYDGRKFFQALVLICVAATMFTFVLSQLRNEWTGKVARFAKYFAAAEVGLFVGFAAKKGWEGTQLLLGLVVGMYMFHQIQALSLITPYVKIVAVHSVWICAVATLSVVLGCWMLHQSYGGGRVLGLVAPLFGSSLVVATCGYVVMFAASIPDIGKVLHVVVSRENVPSIFEFWYMITSPLHSQAVGIFHFTGRHLVIGTNVFEVDRILGIFFWVVFALLGARYQLREDKKERQAASDSVKARLLANMAPA